MTPKNTNESRSEVYELFDEHLEVLGARVHNLKNIDIAIPRNKLVVITGISGSGKSSLAFDTIFAEGQRRYMECLSAYARQFMGEMERPDVDKILGLSPVISIEQKTTGRNPRSTVGTTTELYDFFRLFYARASDAYSKDTGILLQKFSEDQILDHIFQHFDQQKLTLLAPLVKGRKGHYREIFESTRKMGFLKIRIDGDMCDLTPAMQLDRYKVHDVELVIDRIVVNEKEAERIKKSVQLALKHGNGQIMLGETDSNKTPILLSKTLFDPSTGASVEDPSPNAFSFNSPYGACACCKGLGFKYTIDPEKMISDNTKSIASGGIAPLGELRENFLFTQVKNIAKKGGFSVNTPIKDIPETPLNLILYGSTSANIISEESALDVDRWYTLAHGGLAGMIIRCLDASSTDNMRRWAEDFVKEETCPDCHGFRLKAESLLFKIDGKHIGEIANLNLSALQTWLDNIETRLSQRQNLIARDLLKEIRMRLAFLLDVGLGYLSMDRPARTLSGGEAQRVRLATQIGSQLTGITYILDEPTIGLHQRDNARLISALKDLRDSGNTVLVVEHDKDLMLQSDFIIDIGPRAGIHGGQIVAQHIPSEFLKLSTLTADYLSGRKTIPYNSNRRKGSGKHLVIKNAHGHNLKNLTVRLPLGTLICVSGVSGSGKSSLINETLYPALMNHFYRSRRTILPFDGFEGLEFIDKVIEIDQSPIGRTPRSNPATYTDLLTHIRALYAIIPESRIRGYKPGRFSFNVKGGRCDACEGDGLRKIEMNFLPDVYVPCEVCQGKRFNRETLEIHYKGKNIADILDMTVEDALHFFEHIPKVHRQLETLHSVGLDYIKLGQPSTTLSGGEAQRVKLASELSKRDTGQTLYILDEPTTGLHFEDIRVLMEVIQRLVDKGNTVIIIEHNLDVIKLGDWLIDMGPEGGDAGGQILVQGTPEQVVKAAVGYTGVFLAAELN